MWSDIKEAYQRRKNIVKILVFLILLLLLLYLRQRYHIHTLEELQLFTQQYTDPVTLSLTFLVITMTASLCFVPISIFKAFAGMYFGFLFGFFLAFSAALLSAVVSFGTARFIGNEGVEAMYQQKFAPRLSEKQRYWMDKTRSPGFLHVFILRNLYFIPFTPVNYLLGVSKISFLTYLLATITGMLPGSLGYIYFFSRSLSLREDPLSLWPIALGLPVYYFILWRLREKMSMGKSNLHSQQSNFKLPRR